MSDSTRNILKQSGEIPMSIADSATPTETFILQLLLGQNSELAEIKSLARSTNGRVNRHDDEIREIKNWQRIADMKSGQKSAASAAANAAVDEYRAKLWKIPKVIWAVVSVFGAGIGLELIKIFLSIFFHYQLP